MRLRRQFYPASVHTTGERGRPITLCLAGLTFDFDTREATQLAQDLVAAIDAATVRERKQ